MNRFRREEIAAANVLFDVPPTPFSWSVSRHLLFSKCRRAYFLHYYFAQGGWDQYADPLLQFTWSTKKFKTYQEWLERYLEEILRYSFDTLRNVPPAFRTKMLATRIQARLAVLEKQWSEDNTNSFDWRRGSVELKDALAAFLKSQTCSTVATAQNMTLFNKAFKPSFLFNGIELWYNPGLIWREGQQLISCRLHFSKPEPAFIRAESDMFALSARENTGTMETLSIFRYRTGNEWKEVQCRGDAKFCELRIKADVNEMTQLSSGEKVSMIDFPPAADQACFNCRYAAVCSAVTEQFGEI